MQKGKRLAKNKRETAKPLFALAVKKGDRVFLHGGDAGLPLFDSVQAALAHGTFLFGENPQSLKLLAVRIGEIAGQE
jgi:hypothetical protein